MEAAFAMKVRIKFRKYGVMKFIGHLDVMRYFQKAMRRAEIPIAYSEGFSPHQIMSFAAPLGVGLTSDGEYLDIVCVDEKMDQAYTGKTMLEALNKVMVEGVEVTDVKRLPDSAGNAMASVAAARYQVAFREGLCPAFCTQEVLESFAQLDTIPVTKVSKKNTRELDLKPGLYELFLTENEYGKCIEMLVDASSAGNIKPGLVIEAFCKKNGMEELPEAALLIHRIETYGNHGTVEAPDFVPLSAFGEEF